MQVHHIVKWLRSVNTKKLSFKTEIQTSRRNSLWFGHNFFGTPLHSYLLHFFSLSFCVFFIPLVCEPVRFSQSKNTFFLCALKHAVFFSEIKILTVTGAVSLETLIFLALSDISNCFVVVSIILQAVFCRTDMEKMDAAAMEACVSGEFMRGNLTSWAATAPACHIIQVQSFPCHNIFDSGK